MKALKESVSSNAPLSLVLRMRVRDLVLANRRDEVPSFIAAAMAQEADAISRRQLCAELLNEAGFHEQSDEIYDGLLADFPDLDDVRLRYVKQLRHRGRIRKAICVAETLERAGADAATQSIVDGLRRAERRFSESEPDLLTDRPDNRIPALCAAILRFAGRRLPETDPGRIGPVVLMTAGLGVGGAERQFWLFAQGLHRGLGADRILRGVRLDGPVHVVSLAEVPSAQRLLFEAALPGSLPATDDLCSLPPQPIEAVAQGDPVMAEILAITPSAAQIGVRQLAPYFRRTGAAAVSIWQDGPILYAALAALVAEVPKVLLNLRALSPDKHGTPFLLQYAAMFRALALVPGVVFQCNSPSVAQSYADWLGIPTDTFQVIPNGCAPPTLRGSDEDEALWTDFSATTADAERTVGCICRLHPCKRPDLWLDFARHYLDRRPGTRFLLIGYGEALDDLRSSARRSGLGDRLLMPGFRSNVGFWLGKMDVFVFTSRSEGLPNVLIEAQYCGVPVVSTRAGGASDCYIEGVTGATLSNLDNPDLDEIADLTDRMIAMWRADPALGDRARAFAADAYSVETMVRRYAEAMRAPAGAASARGERGAY
ncbi:glycosyltransferase [Rhodovulum steppense]|uniref:Glycosyltransferase involved in cell wall biosynthesis n=1 Tax=Rhodovulum steppense TaxID=540251 RepID=A0A4R1YX07_9RHOB|nr:glycosyltransferase [Rhodovulum steppense]TCM85527.1 glycosyltransferase involved in cell wall biosynthesis [Rhodovulum steppense]